MLNNIIIKSIVFYILLSQLVTVTHAHQRDSFHHEKEQCFICLHNADQQEGLFNSPTFKVINKTHIETIHYTNQYITFSRLYLFKNRDPPVLL